MYNFKENRILVLLATLMLVLNVFFIQRELWESFDQAYENGEPDGSKPKDLLGLSAPPPCSNKDDRYQIFQSPHYGQLCMEDASFGLDNIKSYVRDGNLWEPKLVERFKNWLKPGDVVVDIGAHIGLHSIVLSQIVGERGQVHAFEPNWKIYQESLVNLKLNKLHNVRTHFAALGPSFDRITMSANVSGNEGHTHIGHGGNIVELRTLDSYHFKKVRLIKIDVEGAELGVLKGAKKTILESKPALIIEVFRENQDKVFTFLEAMGYEHHPIGYPDYWFVPRGGAAELKPHLDSLRAD